MAKLRLEWMVIAGPLLAITLSGCGKPADSTGKPRPLAIQAGKELANNGREGLLACTTCHGANGEGNTETGYPRLAGLHPDYIAKQLQDFRRDPLDVGVAIDPIPRDYSKTPRIYKTLTIYSPGTRNDPTMNGIARAMTDEEISNIGAYYGSLPFTATPVPGDFQSLERGLELAVRGKPEYMVPRCDACHGPQGEGFGQYFPPLAGQPIQYLISQMNKWQTGDRDNDHMAMMKNTANMLTDGDKINVAKYYANQSYSVNVKR
jgi:cytochrome c553